VALEEVAGITEVLDNERVLDQIFASFCIGK
jgi:tRNA U34 5-carboxymethylaminomethyl modifying GTPase MnmE/TrmE